MYVRERERTVSCGECGDGEKGGGRLREEEGGRRERREEGEKGEEVGGREGREGEREERGERREKREVTTGVRFGFSTGYVYMCMCHFPKALQLKRPSQPLLYFCLHLGTIN